MTISKEIIADIKDLVTAISTLDVPTITQRNWQSRTTTIDLERVMLEYGNTFIAPPENFFDYAECYDFEDGTGYQIEIPLWTLEEGRSDLVVTIELNNNSKEISISDLRVP
ncbi:hypothetical protein KSS93_18015 [Pseudomonas xanthosomatis]|uniref:DUF7668 domain-containing protein n=1 Tax=Pseudomonas xanthosomatis TaxID=2842356 RepID=UPI001C3CDA6F|nr:hypothetical protein [Pseudomonas xanthosomatis]QXH44774.1 hypothetical protein KSS93_18015 [Pseudomonas xanthosomatis]